MYFGVKVVYLKKSTEKRRRYLHIFGLDVLTHL